MKIRLKRLNNAFHMEATNELGKTVEMDGSPKIGGNNLAVRPMELLLMSLAGCSSIDVLMILKKMKQNVLDYDVEVTANREADKEPSLFTEIHIKYLLKGDLDSAKVKRAVQLSVEKYCSVSKILEPTATVTWSYEIG